MVPSGSQFSILSYIILAFFLDRIHPITEIDINWIGSGPSGTAPGSDRSRRAVNGILPNRCISTHNTRMMYI